MTKDTDELEARSNEEEVQFIKGQELECFQHPAVSGSLGMNHVDAKLMDIRLAMAMNIRRLRKRASVPRELLAEKLSISVEDVDRMESAHTEVLFETYLRTLLALGFNAGPFTVLVD